MSLTAYTAKTWVDYADTPDLSAANVQYMDSGIALVTAEVIALEASLPTTYQPISAELSALAGLSTAGYAKRLGAGSWGIVASIPQTDVTGLTAALASIPLPSVTSPAMNGTAAIGALTTRFALADHVHPSDTTKLGASAQAVDSAKLGGQLPAYYATASSLSSYQTVAGMASYSTKAVADTLYQPLDSDLTAIAALTTTAYGRGFLPLADAAAARTYIGAQVAGSYQPLDADLTAIAALGTTGFVRRTAADTWVASAMAWADISGVISYGTGAGTVAQGNDSRILNGQTAYGWGNHASVGYLTSASTLDPAKITQTSSYRFVTDIEKAAWSSKQSALGYTPLKNTTDTFIGTLTLNGSVVGSGDVSRNTGSFTSTLSGFNFTGQDGSTGAGFNGLLLKRGLDSNVAWRRISIANVIGDKSIILRTEGNIAYANDVSFKIIQGFGALTNDIAASESTIASFSSAGIMASVGLTGTGATFSGSVKRGTSELWGADNLINDQTAHWHNADRVFLRTSTNTQAGRFTGDNQFAGYDYETSTSAPDNFSGVYLSYKNVSVESYPNFSAALYAGSLKFTSTALNNAYANIMTADSTGFNFNRPIYGTSALFAGLVSANAGLKTPTYQVSTASTLNVSNPYSVTHATGSVVITLPTTGVTAFQPYFISGNCVLVCANAIAFKGVNVNPNVNTPNIYGSVQAIFDGTYWFVG